MEISEIKKYEKNAKAHPDWHIEKIANSIKAFGCKQPIVLDSKGEIIAGHGRFIAMTEKLGYTKLEAKSHTAKGEETIPYVLADDLSPKEVKALRLADNQLNAMTGLEMDLVIEELKDLSSEMLDLTGFDSDLFLDKYDDYETGSIKDRFLFAPFSVLDSRRGEWQARKRQWLDMGIKSEEGRSDDLLGNVGYYADKDKENKNKRSSGLKLLSQKQNTEYKSGIGLTGTSIFDPVLCELMYLWFAPQKATILDPFAGGSVRGIVASKLGHKYKATELRAEQVAANIEQGNELITDTPMPVWVADDALNVKDHFSDTQFDMLMTCPPYADLEVYSDDLRDISTMEYKTFLEVYRNIIDRSTSLLKDNTFAVCVVGEVRDKNGAYKNFVADTIQSFEDAGLHYYNEIILVNMVGTLGMRITKQFSSGRKIGKTHQNILVFWKGDIKQVNKTVAGWGIKGDIFAKIDSSQEE